MARSRNIKPTFFTNEYLGELEPLARLLFAGLWCQADREGRLQDRPKRLKIDILPYDDCDIDKLLNDLADSKGDFIRRYTVDGNRYIQINNFLKHQNPHKKEIASIIPEYKSVLVSYEHGASTVQKLCNIGTDIESEQCLSNTCMEQLPYNTDSSSDTEQYYDNASNVNNTVTESCENDINMGHCTEQEQVLNGSSRADSLNPLTDSLNPINTDMSTEVDVSDQNYCPHDKIIQLFNTICTSLPRVKQLTEGRKNKLKARWGEIKKIDGFKSLFEKVQSNTFLKGSNNSGWKATFDWLIENDRNYVKVLEGNYDNDGSNPPPTAPKTGRTNRDFDQREYQEDFYSEFYSNTKGDKK